MIQRKTPNNASSSNKNFFVSKETNMVKNPSFAEFIGNKNQHVHLKKGYHVKSNSFNNTASAAALKIEKLFMQNLKKGNSSFSNTGLLSNRTENSHNNDVTCKDSDKTIDKTINKVMNNNHSMNQDFRPSITSTTSMRRTETANRLNKPNILGQFLQENNKSVSQSSKRLHNRSASNSFSQTQDFKKRHSSYKQDDIHSLMLDKLTGVTLNKDRSNTNSSKIRRAHSFVSTTKLLVPILASSQDQRPNLNLQRNYTQVGSLNVPPDSKKQQNYRGQKQQAQINTNEIRLAQELNELKQQLTLSLQDNQKLKSQMNEYQLELQKNRVERKDLKFELKRIFNEKLEQTMNLKAQVQKYNNNQIFLTKRLDEYQIHFDRMQ